MYNNVDKRRKDMKSDVVLGIIVGAIIGMGIATYCKGAQEIVKKSGEAITDGAKNLIEKAKGE